MAAIARHLNVLTRQTGGDDVLELFSVHGK
jgi:hypothetical protein